MLDQLPAMWKRKKTEKQQKLLDDFANIFFLLSFRCFLHDFKGKVGILRMFH